ncbi:MAG: hypothetical protein RMJ56_11940 [Gemmataceae bacterium]|nr:hypothetical protein [Gemmata sp.]MDW8198302.1 hypothetical protein [Gemmataceae bacterium]
MRQLWGVVVGVVVAAGIASGQEFQWFASAAGKYKVLFPGAVKSEVREISAGKETLRLYLDSVELKGDTVFLVSYVDASEEVAKKPAGPRLDKVRDGNKGERGQVIEEKDITLSLGSEKFPGRDLLIETPQGYLRNRVVIVGRRLYQVMVQGTKEVVTSSAADKFINSFELTK